MNNKDKSLYMDKKSMRTKVLRTLTLLSLFELIIVGAFTITITMLMRNTFIKSSEKAGTKAEHLSANSVQTQTKERLTENATNKANYVNEIFAKFENSVKIEAETASRLYDNDDDYGDILLPRPSMKNKDKLAVQLLNSASISLKDPKIRHEAALLGNAGDVLYSINNNFENMASCYLASESGIMIQCDYISQHKFDENGKLLPYEAAERPWYIGAKKTQRPFFTSLAKDIHTGRYCIMCGVPFYKRETFKGVAGAGLYLTDVENIVKDSKIGEDGYACIIDQYGKVIFSGNTDPEGELSVNDDVEDVRKTGNSGLVNLATDATDGKSGIESIEIDGKKAYVAYAPMEATGWSFLVILDESIANKPTDALVDALSKSTEDVVNSSGQYVRNMLILTLIIIVVLLLVSLTIANKMASKLSMPIVYLTEEVSKVQGDNLEFSWDNNDAPTEIGFLARSFSLLTQRMKDYIRDITEITAEKERIGAELNVATQIQADMLPRIFPPFAGRDDFEMYASMNPAKEVGGDFYDFFFVDDKHIALVMADVSGKGVPAALFMVIAKTLIKNRTISGGSPSEILEDVNNQLCEGNDAGLFVTVWLGIIDITTGKGMAANAGHEHPILRRAGQQYEFVKYRHSPAVATMEGIPFKEHEFELYPGDTLFVYTDGVAEATNSDNELFGEERTLKALNRDVNAKPEIMLNNVLEDINEFVGDAVQFDDITMLAFNYLGPNVRKS